MINWIREWWASLHPNLTLTNQVIEVLKENKITKPEQLEAHGIKLRSLDYGSFREVHKVIGADLVIKFPLKPEYAYHSVQEIKTIRLIHRRRDYKPLRPYTPELYYGNLKTGVLVMPYYKRELDKNEVAVLNLLVSLIQTTWPFAKEKQRHCDLGFDNVRLGEDGNPVILDFGYFGEEGGAW
jgi:hypothetical protein